MECIHFLLCTIICVHILLSMHLFISRVRVSSFCPVTSKSSRLISQNVKLWEMAAHHVGVYRYTHMPVSLQLKKKSLILNVPGEQKWAPTWKKRWGATVCEYIEDKEVWYRERLVQARRKGWGREVPVGSGAVSSWETSNTLQPCDQPAPWLSADSSPTVPLRH